MIIIVNIYNNTTCSEPFTVEAELNLPATCMILNWRSAHPYTIIYKVIGRSNVVCNDNIQLDMHEVVPSIFLSWYRTCQHVNIF